MSAGLPVFAVVNKDNDLIDIIQKSDVGKVNTYDANIDELVDDFKDLINSISINTKMRIACKRLYNSRYRTSIAADKLLSNILLPL